MTRGRVKTVSPDSALRRLPEGDAGRTFLDRLTFIITVANYPVEQRAAVIAKEGLTVGQVEGWRIEAKQRLPGLVKPAVKRRSTKSRRIG